MAIPQAKQSTVFTGMGINVPPKEEDIVESKSAEPIKPQVLGNPIEGSVLLKPIKLTDDHSIESKA